MLQRLNNPWEGIDVSKWQGAIDFIQVKASGKKFVLIRAGYGRQMAGLTLTTRSR